MKLNQVQLDKNQKEILRIFIEQFLPKRGTKRKNSGNEMDYIRTTLNLVFIKNFGFNLNRRNIIEAFEEQKYTIFIKNSEWDSESKKYKPSIKGNSVRFGDVYSDYNAAYIYVDIEPLIVRQLMLTVRTLPEHTNQLKVNATNEMNKRIELFRKTHNNKLA
jgi:hypothetical protein